MMAGWANTLFNFNGTDARSPVLWAGAVQSDVRQSRFIGGGGVCGFDQDFRNITQYGKDILTANDVSIGALPFAFHNRNLICLQTAWRDFVATIMIQRDFISILDDNVGGVVAGHETVGMWHVSNGVVEMSTV